MESTKYKGTNEPWGLGELGGSPIGIQPYNVLVCNPTIFARRETGFPLSRFNTPCPIQCEVTPTSGILLSRIIPIKALQLKIKQ